MATALNGADLEENLRKHLYDLVFGKDAVFI